jgi:hypothetical protein
LRRDVAPADQREDEVEFGDDDAAKGEGVDGIGGEEPPDLRRVNGVVECMRRSTNRWLAIPRQSFEISLPVIRN